MYKKDDIDEHTGELQGGWWFLSMARRLLNRTSFKSLLYNGSMFVCVYEADKEWY